MGLLHFVFVRYGESIGNVMLVAELAWPNSWVLLIGSFTSCVGAGLQCLCTAPRLLQSIAKDNLVPVLNVFVPMTKRNEPFRALVATTIIAECAILIGGIDYIAPVVDFFFLTSYCVVNVACALQTLLKAPNWRPRFRFYHWTLAVLGAFLNLFIMFSTYWYYAIVVIILCAGLYKYIEFKGAKKEWGDGMRGLALTTAQYSLLRVEEDSIHPKNWRPQLLVMLKLKPSEQTQNRKMLHLANQLKAGRGLTMVCTMIEGDLNIPEDRDAAKAAREKLKQAMQDAKVKGFTEVAICNNVSDNVGTVIQCVGMGALRPNTVILGWPYKWRNSSQNNDGNHCGILDAVHRATAADRCLLIAKGLHMFPDAGDQLVGEIDVWWIIHDGAIKMKEDLQNWVYQLRINAQIHIVELDILTIAPYSYERTIVMEERAKLAMNLRLNDHELQNEPQLLADRNRNELTADLFRRSTKASNKKISIANLKPATTGSDSSSSCPGKIDSLQNHDNKAFYSDSEEELVRHENEDADEKDGNDAGGETTKTSSKPNKRKLAKRNSVQCETDKFASVDRKMVRKMHMAIKLNKAIRERSSTSRLVILNLPPPPRAKEAMHQYMEYLEVLTESLERVLLVRGSGKEVITIYS